MRISFLVLLFSLLGLSVSAQPTFEKICFKADSLVRARDHRNMQKAWFITGQDTVYTFQFIQGNCKLQVTPFSKDSLYKSADSLVLVNIAFPIKFATTRVYLKGNMIRQEFLENGKRTRADWWQYDEVGRKIYHREWWPGQEKITRWPYVDKREMIIKNRYNGLWTYRKVSGDTNRVYSMTGKDTSNHNISWPGYHEVKRYKNLYISRDWGTQDSNIRAVRTADMADSTIMVQKTGLRLYLNYHASSTEDYSLTLYSEAYGNQPPDSIFQFRPQSDTAFYSIESYGPVAGGMYRKKMELRLRKDSSRYKKIDYIWKENGEIDHLEITNRWGFSKKKKVDWSKVQLPVGCTTGTNAQLRQSIEQYDYRFRILTNGLDEIMIERKSLKFEIMANLNMNNPNVPSTYGEGWIESILLEVNTERTLGNIYTNPRSQL